MQADTQRAQNPGVPKIRALLIAARPGLAAEGRELVLAFKEPPQVPGKPVSDRSPAIARLIEHLRKLRADVESTTVEGAAAVSTRDLTARALLETDQALGKLAETYAAPDQRSATILLAESVRLRKGGMRAALKQLSDGIAASMSGTGLNAS